MNFGEPNEGLGAARVNRARVPDLFFCTLRDAFRIPSKAMPRGRTSAKTFRVFIAANAIQATRGSGFSCIWCTIANV